ncbi:MAG TPA: hypothetical protein VFU29_06785 [Chitinophagaceae bacterium]|nr:hypothetical protein [Chitinophagaceae bacterium]
MNKLLTLIYSLCLFSSHSLYSQTTSKVKQYVIDQSSLSDIDKKIIKEADSLANNINKNLSNYVRVYDTSVVENNIKNHIIYKAYYHSDRKKIVKIIVLGSSKTQNGTYTFYYFENIPLKVDGEIFDDPPVALSVYFNSDRHIFPKEIGLTDAKFVQKMGYDLIDFFKKRY